MIRHLSKHTTSSTQSGCRRSVFRYFTIGLFIFLIGCSLVLIIHCAEGDGHGDYPYSGNGDWTIGKSTYAGNETIEMNGNLIVNNGGSLTLRNVILIFKNPAPGEFGIEVNREGTLRILDLDDDPATEEDRSIIKPDDPKGQFFFWVKEGAGFTMRNSEVSSCGYEWGNDGRSGLTIQAKSSTVENTHIHDCYDGINVQAELTTIKGCLISDNSNYGIIIQSQFTTVTGCVITDNENTGIYSGYMNTDIRECTADRNGGGISVVASNSNITDCTVLENDWTGIMLQGSNIRLMGCNASSNGGSGITLMMVQNSEVLNCDAMGNGQYGLNQDMYCTNNEIRNCRFSGNNVGLYITQDFFGMTNITDCEVWENSRGVDITADNVNIKDTTIWNCEIGMRISGSTNTIERCNSTNNSVGFDVQSYSNFNMFSYCRANQNTDSDFRSLGNSRGNDISAFWSGSTIISFTYDNGISIGALPNPPPDPENKENIGKFLNINNITRTSWINLNVHYTDAEIEDMLESTLRVYHFKKEWEEVPGSMVYPAWNAVNANITDFSPFAVLGDPNPLERTVKNLETGETFYYIQDAIDSSATKDGHTIKVQPRTYVENVEIYKEVDIVGDPLIEANGGIGIWVQANNVLVENMSITNGTIGVYVYNQSFGIRGVTLFNITAYDNNIGIHLWNARENEIVECHVSDNKNTGIILQNSSKNVVRDIIGTSIRGDGLTLDSSRDNVIRNATFAEVLGTGVRLDDSEWNILIGILSSENDKGFHIYHSSNNSLLGCVAEYNDYEGFYIQSNTGGVSNDNELVDCHAISNENGIHIYGNRFNVDLGSNSNAIRDCNASGNDWNGIWLWGADFTEIERTVLFGNDQGIDISYTSSQTRIIDSEIIDSNDIDIVVRADAIDGVAINTTFVSVNCDESSSLYIQNYLHIHTQDALGNPLAGTEVLVEDGDVPVHASPHYGGKDATTDGDGMVTNILVTDRAYEFSPLVYDIVNNVSVWHSDEEINRTVAMDESHLETFSFRFKFAAAIDSIDPGDAFEGDLVTFRGHGTPPDRIKLFVWRSDRDGELHNGSESNFSYDGLSPGFHTIFLRVRDEQGSWSEETWATVSVNDILPTANIDSIVPAPATEGDMITFTGSGTDGQGSIQEYVWTSTLLQLPLNNNATFSTSSLLPGNHTIGFSVKDDEGSWSPMVTTPLYINAMPTARIESIDPSQEIIEGDVVEFVGSGIDPNGTIIAYQWASDIQGAIGDTATFTSANLKPGNHTIMLRVQDGDGVWSDPATWSISIIASVPLESDDWFIISTWDDDDELEVRITLTELGQKHLQEISSVRLWIDSLPLEKELLYDSKRPNFEPELRGEKLFEVEEFILTPFEFRLNGTIRAMALPNDHYTLRMEALADRPPNLSGPPIVLNGTEKNVLLEHPRNTWGPVLGGAGIGIGLSGAGELLKAKGGAAAEGAAVEGEVKPLRIRSKIRRRLLKKSNLFTFITLVVAVLALVLAFGYTMMASPSKNPRENMELFDSIVLSARSTFFDDLFLMLPYLMAVMGIIILFRLWVDWLASKGQGIDP